MQSTQIRNTAATYSSGNRSLFNKPNYNKSQPKDNRSVVKDGNKKDKPTKGAMQSSWGSFRIPRKNDS